MILTASQIYALARQAGFPPVVAVTMTAIALRESSGNTAVANDNAHTGDRSYGLWQINMFGALKDKRLAQFGIANEMDLLDPAVNAAAAYRLWGGLNQNLGRAWYINRPGPYKAQYEKHLAAAQDAAINSPAT